MSTQIIQWYPGHIAKAEQQLSKSLEKVDLVVEVRDARIPLATGHPCLHKWIRNKKHLLVINRRDMISQKAFNSWDNWFKENGQEAWWCNAKDGNGTNKIKEAAIKLGNDLNNRRESRGMRKRAVRALILGFPNVGKSALINRLVNKKVVKSARRAGVTKSLQWVRVGQQLDLLDAPGVLPPQLEDQEAAVKLALCDDIGQASYDVESVAIKFLNILNQVKNESDFETSNQILEKRYGISWEESNNNVHLWLENAANYHTSGNTNRMSQRLLDDFRKRLIGTISLELP
ncbi:MULTISPECIES: ribosome biogenesis GTPase YlqF [Prochlorococcus]|uniref:Ribosome biogenesis GTPase A n=1 Tax=Prochlorococcus marinus (strain SARG / CCMP1375 / SS120) TaxID=167539 RepID=Q7VDZ5_PROMA|nr:MULTISPECIES: ribosome biogenesis GTPase YlqF [Prochlorococcus]AAP99266.1 Predicted GTPase [Prochlorococcus marinus subsp. marinus str. CCMP1375]KGG11464.1 50S ribosomal subunit maturation GTPase RbgA [Prochlorococcus marinus str. LG]KGG18581.1 50S ribosomal subunit maturation GTPase RbgA [Prochlorococcus marinus str. SS2]KGG22854.1 50S ribosomal subunit maturation GTPase RbgA [Prochlorococcus marinus str. SS35]KGG32730.1 50S ribosomal subunit maturation GTPase RbgA [Prochlorococcus marinus